MLTVLNTTDVGKFTRSRGEDSASLSSVFDQIVRERQYELSDPKARFNPLSAKGLFYGLQWENSPIEEKTETGNVIYIGAINNVSHEISQSGRKTIVNARDQFGVLIDWVVEDADLISFAASAKQYKLSSDYAAQATGSLSISASGGPSDIPVGAYVSFGLNIVPRYLVTEITGSGPTTAIKLDRPLEIAVTSGDILRVIAPTEKTGAKAIKDTLIAAGLENRIGYTFDKLDSEDTANNYKLRIFVRQESKTKLSDYVNKVMELTDLFITVNPDTGIINCFRGLQYDGSTIFDSIEPADMIPSITATFDKSKFYYAYDLLCTNGGGVAIQSGETSSRAKKRWQPIQSTSNKSIDYDILYASASAAVYFGERKIAYYSVPRIRIRFGLKRAKSGSPRKFFNITVGKKFLISIRLGNGEKLLNQPCIVTAYAYSKEKQVYNSVEVELTNWIAVNTYEAGDNYTFIVADDGSNIVSEDLDLIIE